jgi:hypothetical protein
MIPRDPTRPPPGYEAELAAYGPVVFDGGQPIGWGFRIMRRLGEMRFRALEAFGDLHCQMLSGLATEWSLVTRWLSPAEAAEKYGAVTSVERGPRGGFRSVTYGSTRFTSRRLAPEATKGT